LLYLPLILVVFGDIIISTWFCIHFYAYTYNLCLSLVCSVTVLCALYTYPTGTPLRW